MLQPTPYNNHDTLSATATIFISPVPHSACGCFTWKHEQETDECSPMSEQELAIYLKYAD